MPRLYLDDHPELVKAFSKEAGYVARLSDEPQNWAQEATSEMLRRHPWLSDYEISPTVDKMDPEKGFAFGFLDISNRTERPEQEHEEAGIPHIRIPMIVEDHQLRPFSVFMDGDRVMPMNEDRVRETLFNPQAFDLSTIPPADPSLIEQWMPPNRTGVGVGGEFKLASADAAFFAGLEKEALFDGVKQRIRSEAAAGAEEAVKKLFRKAAPKALAGVAATATAAGAAGHVAGKRAGAKAAREAQQAPQAEKTAFAHITPEQWQALYQNDKVKGLVEKYGKYDHPEVTNAVFELASKRYGYHPKTASVHGDSLLLAIAPTISEKAAQAFVNKLASDATIKVGLRSVSDLLIEAFDNTKRASAEDYLRTIAENIQPTVMTLQRLPGGDFLVKSAAVNAFSGGPEAQGQVVPQSEAEEAIGPDNVQGMKPGQSVTAVSDPVDPNGGPEDFDGEPVTRFGQYTVKDTMGNSLMGWVFPELLAWDGNFTPMPTMLFTNGSAYALQDGIIGQMIGQSVGLPEDQPVGEGTFYSVSNDGVSATVPVTLASAMAGPDGSPVYHGSDPFGNPVVLRVTQGLVQPERINNNEYAIPDSWSWMRLNNQTQLQGASGPDGAGASMPGQPPPMPQQPPAHALAQGGPKGVPTKMGNGTKATPTAPGGPGGGSIPGSGGPFNATSSGPPVVPGGGMMGPQAGGAQAGGPPGAEQPPQMGAQPAAGKTPPQGAPKPPGAGKPAPQKADGKPAPNGPPKDKKPEKKDKKPEPKTKSSAAMAAQNTVELYYNGAFQLEGGCGLHKIASEFRYDLDAVSAEFMLGLLGVPGSMAKQKVAEARKLNGRDSVKLAGLKTITTLGERHAESVKTASAFLERLPDLRRDLIKEAAAIRDEGTVDKILALNFINPENVSTFVDYLPDLEQAGERMAEMLIHSYLGQEDMPEAAIEKAMTGMEDVISGLKAIRGVEASQS